MSDSRTYPLVLHVSDQPTAIPTTSESPFEEALAAAWPSLVRFVRATAGASSDLDDVAAQVLEIAWRRRDSLDSSDELVPWLLAIAHNVIRNARRGSIRHGRLVARLAQQRERTAQDAHDELLAHEPGPATRALARLTSADREVLVLHAWEDLDGELLAHVLGISPTAARKRLSRARARLAAALEREDTR